MGDPGLLIYLAIFVCVYLDLWWVRRHSPKDSSYSAVALCSLLSLAGLNVNFFFGSNAYMAWVPIVLGLSAALLQLNLQRDLERRIGRCPAGAASGGLLPVNRRPRHKPPPTRTVF